MKKQALQLAFSVKISCNEYRYGRSIVIIHYDDDEYLSTELIKNGLAWHYKSYSTSKELANFENSARLQKVGLWYDKNPIAPWEWR